MKIENKTVQSLAQEMLDNFTYSKREDGTMYAHYKNNIQWQQDVCHKAHGDRFPNDTIYDIIVSALEIIAECDIENETEDRLYELEPPCYTSELTAWLHSNNNNVYYLTEALSEFETKDGFQVLSYAYSIMQRDVISGLLEGLRYNVE